MDNTSEKFLLVEDSSVNEETNLRTHEIVLNGLIETVEFRYGEKTILPFEKGVKFMGKDGFKVSEVDGKEIVMPAVASDAVSQQLAVDECVAKFAELRTDALKLRAAQRPAGEIYLDATEEDRDQIVGFLSGAAPEAPAPAPVDEDQDTDEVDPLEGTIEAKQAEIVAHFGVDRADGVELVAIGERESDGVVIFGVFDCDEKIVEGTLLELHSAVLQGVSADRFNSDKDAATDVSETATEPNNEEGSTKDAGQIDTTDTEEATQTFTIEQVERASDEALALCAEYGINPDDVQGTGAENNLVKADVEAFITEKGLTASPSPIAAE